MFLYGTVRTNPLSACMKYVRDMHAMKNLHRDLGETLITTCVGFCAGRDR